MGAEMLRKIYDPITNKTSYYDFGTKNESFLLTRKELQAKGIRNNAFMLRIDDLSLVDVDPYDPHLSRDTMKRIVEECHNNLWYFLREVVRIPIQGGKSQLYLHRGSTAQIWLFLQHITTCLELPRRCYKTTNFAAVIAWAETLSLAGGNIALFANKLDQNKRNLQTVKDMIESLPLYMQHETSAIAEKAARVKGSKTKVKKKKSNVETYVDPVTDTHILVFSEAVREAAANQMGRGAAHTIQYFDEAEFIPYLPVILDASASTFKQALIRAKEIGSPGGRAFTTTPGYTNNPVDRTNYEQIVSKFIEWDESLYDMSYDQIMEYAEEHDMSETGNVVFHIKYDYIQCRRDDVWLHEQYVEYSSRAKFRQEILLERISGNETSPFPPEELEYINSHMRQPIATINIYKSYELNIFEHIDHPVMGHFDRNLIYFIGVDPAYGVGGDYTAISIGNPYNMKTAAEFRSEFIGTDDMVALLMKLFAMIPNSILFCEARATGIPIMELLSKTQYGNRIYSTITPDPYKMITDSKSTDPRVLTKLGQAKEAAMRKSLGIPTSSKSRKLMIEILINHMHEYKQTIQTPYLVEDINGLIYMKSSKENTSDPKVVAGLSSHDDNVMSWLMWLYGWYYGENLERYGFRKGSAHPISDFDIDAVEEKRPKPNVTDVRAQDEYSKAYSTILIQIAEAQRVGIKMIDSIQTTENIGELIANNIQEPDFTEFLDYDRELYTADGFDNYVFKGVY